VLSATLLALLWSAPRASAQTTRTGTSYHFEERGTKGQVWVLGDNARKEIDRGEPGTLLEHGRIEIWKNGGREIFVLDPIERPYYQRKPLGKGEPDSEPTVSTLTVREPFRFEQVRNLKFELSAPRLETASGYSCQRSTLSFSYELKLTLTQVPGLSMTGRVAGAASFCMMEAPAAGPPPFKHRAALISGIAAVDAAAAQQLSSLSGMPIAGSISATRQIDTGEAVADRFVFILSDIRPAEIDAERFEVPKDYRFAEPVVVGPVKKH